MPIKEYDKFRIAYPNSVIFSLRILTIFHIIYYLKTMFNFLYVNSNIYMLIQHGAVCLV